MGHEHSTTFQPLWKDYQDWAGRSATLNRRTFSDALGKKFQKEHGQRVSYIGLTLRDDHSSRRDLGREDWTTEIPPMGDPQTEEM